MKVKSILLILGFVLLVGFKSFAQSNSQYFIPNVFGKSPTQAAFEKYGNYPVNLNSGLPDISIPLYTVTSGDLQVPIVLSYHAAGIKVNETASWVGLGWSLNAGGSITRNIMGNPDDGGYLNGGFRDALTLAPHTSTTDLDYLYKTCLQYGGYDARPDIFSYNLPGHSGKFFFNAKDNYNIEYVPFAAIKITNTATPFATATPQFTVLDEKGTTFQVGNSTTETTHSYNSNGTHSYAVTAWMLESMTSQDKKDVISFSYQAQNVTPPDQTGQSIVVEDNPQVYNGSNNLSYCNFTPQYMSATNSTNVNEEDIQRISFKNGYVDFVLAGNARTDAVGANVFPLGSINVYGLNPGNNSYVLQKSIVFFTSYFGQGGTNAQQRLRLDSVQVRDKSGTAVQTYRFSYNSLTMPSYYSYSRDFWGYYNGSKNGSSEQTSLIPQMQVQQILNGGTQATQTTTIGSSSPTSRNPDTTYMQACMLNRITYPTGGHTDFTYQTNRYYDNLGNLQLTGGLRITQIANYDSPTSITPILKTYQYNISRPNFMPNNTTGQINSGFFIHTNRARDFEMTGGQPALTYSKTVRIYYSESASNLTPTDGNPVAYTDVTEYQGTPSNNIGKSVYRFRDHQDDWSGSAPSTGVPVVLDYFFARGQLMEKVDYARKPDGTYQVVKKVDNTYSAFPEHKYQDVGLVIGQTKQTDGCITIAYDGMVTSGAFDSDADAYPYEDYSIVSDDNYLTGTTTYEYDQNDVSKYTTNTVTYKYDNIIHQQVTRAYHTDSRGNTTVTRNKYPADYLNSGTATGNTVIDNMLSRNMQAELIERYDTVKNVTTNVTGITGGELHVYKIGNQGAVVPDSVAKLNVNAAVIDFQPSSVSSGTLNRDSRYVKMISFDQYDNINNLTQYTARNATPVSIAWRYNASLPVVKVTNATVNDIFYEGFEDGAGNGFYNDAKAGHWSYNGNSTVYSKTLTGLDNGQYVLSCWQKSGDSWTLYTSTVTVSGNSITISQNSQLPGGQIDEVRFYPVGALMTTYTYDPIIGMTSAMDPRGNVSYYEYDDFNRLRTIKDQNHNIVKAYCYNYKGQQTNCFVPQNDQPQIVYARVETSNFSSSSNGSETWGYIDVYIRFYADANCTIPLTLSADLDITVMTTEGTATDSNAIPDSYSYNTYYVTAGSSSYYLGNLSLYDDYSYSYFDEYGNYQYSYTDYNWSYDLVSGTTYISEPSYYN